MFFTQDDYKKIQQWLIQNSVKDTEFNEAMSPLNGYETVALVQNGANVKFNIKELLEQLTLLGDLDFINITEAYNERMITLLQAVQLIPYKARKIGQVVTFINEEGKWVIYQYQGSNLSQWNIEDFWVDLLQKLGGLDTLVDEEDLTIANKGDDKVIKFKDKSYNPEEFSGLGRVILRKNLVDIEDPENRTTKRVNLLTQNMVSKENTIYVIQYDFDLNGAEITIPEGCVLDFQGGSLKNGIVKNLSIRYTSYYIFKENLDVYCNNDSYITPFNFGAILDGIEDDTAPINRFYKCLYNSRCLHGGSGTAYVTDTITIPCGCHLPDLNFIYPGGYNKTAIFIDNYRFDLPLAKQSGENMIRDTTITIGSVINKTIAALGSAAIKISCSRNIIVNANRLYGFDAGLLLEGYDSHVGYVSYSTFNIKSIINCKSGIKQRQYRRWDDRGFGWVTECIFNGTQISTPGDGGWDEVIFIDLQVEEGNTLDGHKFNSICLEGAEDTTNTRRWAIVMNNAILNMFYCCRFEKLKAGGIKRIIKENENIYPNTFIGCYGDYAQTSFYNWDNDSKYYDVISPMYVGRIRSSEPIKFNWRNIETSDFKKVTGGLMPYGDIIRDEHPSMNTTRGGGIAVVPSNKDWEREASFIIWTPASSDQSLYYRKGLPKTSEDGKNFSYWEKIQKRPIDAIYGSTTYQYPPEDKAHLYKDGDIFVGYEGPRFKYNQDWISIFGHNGHTNGEVNSMPKKCYIGASFMLKDDTHSGKPVFYIGHKTSDRTEDKWVTADGERIDILKYGRTDQRPTPRYIGFQYFDTTLNKPIWWTGSKWVDATGADV